MNTKIETTELSTSEGVFLIRPKELAIPSEPPRHSHVIWSPEVLLFSLTLALVAGCATPPAYPTRAAADCRAQATKEGLTIGIHPIFDKQEAEHYFGSDLLLRGLLPVLVVVENHSKDASYLLSMNNCSLSQSTGYGSKADLPSREGAALIPGGLIGLAITCNAYNKRTGMAIKELRDQTVSPGQTEDGFVYFKVPTKGTAKGCQLITKVHVPRLGDHQALEFELPLTWER